MPLGAMPSRGPLPIVDCLDWLRVAYGEEDHRASATCLCMRALWSLARYKKEGKSQATPLRSLCLWIHIFHAAVLEQTTHRTVDRDDEAVFRCPIWRDALMTIRAEPFLPDCVQDTSAAARRDSSASLRARLRSSGATRYCQTPETKGGSVHGEKGRQGTGLQGKGRWSQAKPSRAGETRLGPAL